MVKKRSAMDRLLEEGFFDSREAALPYLMSGAVYCGAQPVTTGGQLVPSDKPMTVRGLYDRYVGKGGYKLEGAIRDFGIALEGRVCIDAGACTGGFTDCLIQHGAALVYAVEVGFGQLAGSLSQDERVVNLELSLIHIFCLFTVLLFAMCVWRHRTNIQRLMSGTENRIGQKAK